MTILGVFEHSDTAVEINLAPIKTLKFPCSGTRLQRKNYELIQVMFGRYQADFEEASTLIAR